VDVVTALDAALTYAARGWRVLPIASGSKRPCGRYGLWHASCLPDVIGEWYARWPRAGVAVACAPSGLLVDDTDRRHGGDPRALELAGDLPATFAVATHDGLHRYWQHPGGRVRPALDPARFPGHDIKADGYVLAPPTPHPDGGNYALIDETPPAPMPAWLRELVVLPPPKPRPTSRVRNAKPYVRAAVEQEARTVATTPEGGGSYGGRNKQLNVSTYALARFVANGELDATTVVTAMTDAARAAGLTGEVGPPHKGEIGPTIASAFKARGIIL
jgi:hypothetical protein